MTDLKKGIADLAAHLDAARKRQMSECDALRTLLGALQNDATSQNASQEDCDAIDALEDTLNELDPAALD